MNARRLGLLVRAVRVNQGWRQSDLAHEAGVSASTVSRLERGIAGTLTLDTVERIASALNVRTELTGRWQGGDGDRLLNWRHSLLANSVARCLRAHDGWRIVSEASFSIFGERGFIDHLCWHEACAHLLVIELKTEFVDFNDLLGTMDRKVRLARRIAAERGWDPRLVSVWLMVADSRTNRRHAAHHAALLRNRFTLDGRSLQPFLANPTAETAGLAFWPDSRRGNVTKEGPRILTRVRARKATGRSNSGGRKAETVGRGAETAGRGAETAGRGAETAGRRGPAGPSETIATTLSGEQPP
jgi:transcriptional regulator with XRE-family HTH domain